MREIRFFNTLGRTLEPFTPRRQGSVDLYTCGPTVYDHAHIGNLKTFVFEDFLRRSLSYLGYQVTQVMNLTDVDDKTIRGSIAEGVSLNDRERVWFEMTEAMMNDLNTSLQRQINQHLRAFVR